MVDYYKRDREFKNNKLEQIVQMKGLQKMDPKNRNRLQQALQGKRTRTGAREESATDKLMIQDFFDMKPIKLPADAWKDHKKLTRFLGEVHEYLNRLVRACQM